LKLRELPLSSASQLRSSGPTACLYYLYSLSLFSFTLVPASPSNRTFVTFLASTFFCDPPIFRFLFASSFLYPVLVCASCACYSFFLLFFTPSSSPFSPFSSKFSLLTFLFLSSLLVFFLCDPSLSASFNLPLFTVPPCTLFRNVFPPFFPFQCPPHPPSSFSHHPPHFYGPLFLSFFFFVPTAFHLFFCRTICPLSYHLPRCIFGPPFTFFPLFAPHLLSARADFRIFTRGYLYFHSLLLRHPSSVQIPLSARWLCGHFSLSFSFLDFPLWHYYFYITLTPLFPSPRILCLFCYAFLLHHPEEVSLSSASFFYFFFLSLLPPL